MSELKRFVETWMAAVERGDVEAVVEMCAPDVELVSPDGDLKGRDQVRTMFRTWVDGFSDRHHPISNTVEQGDTIVAEFLLIGTNSGPLPAPQGGAIPPTGKSVRLPSIGIYEIKQGKLVRSRGQYNQLALMAQLGLLPAPVPA